MSAIIKIENLRDLIIEIRDESVLLNAEVAQLYGVETRDINKAVANNPNKFPAGCRPFEATSLLGDPGKAKTNPPIESVMD